MLKKGKTNKVIYLDSDLYNKVKAVSESINFSLSGLIENIVIYVRTHPEFVRTGIVVTYGKQERKAVSLSLTDSIIEECTKSADSMSLSFNRYLKILLCDFLVAPEIVQKDILLVRYTYQPIIIETMEEGQ